MSNAPGVCALCGLPLRYGRFVLSQGDNQIHFCCQGCRQVYIMLSEAAEVTDPAAFRHTDLFRRCVEMGVIPRSEDDLAAAAQASSGCDTVLSDDPSPRTDREDCLTLHFSVAGMWCPACAWVIEETLNKKPGVDGACCNFSTDRLRCRYDPTRTSPDEIQRFVQRLGYRAQPPDALVADREHRREFVRFVISTFLTMNVMMLSFALYTGFFTQLESDAVWKISWPMFFMATVVLTYGGLPIHQKGLSGMLRGQAGMEALISIGAASAYSYSVVNLLKGGIHLYFDTTCMLIILVQLGKLLERRAKDRIQEDLGHYYALMPAKVRLCSDENDRGRYVAAESLRTGDLFRVMEGETLAADGYIKSGQGLVDASSLTGEARPQPRGTGHRLVSGTRVVEGTFLVQTEKVGQSSTLGQMLTIMDTALSRKTNVEGRTDWILRMFVPGIVVLSLATAMVLLVRGAAFEEAFIRALTVLVISCPCALGVAVPLARVAGVTLGARRGILVQDFAAFDKAGRVDTVVFDKTGTLTRGFWQLQVVEPMGSLQEETIIGLAAGLEHKVDHSIAVEIQRTAKARRMDPITVTAVKIHERGVSGCWNGKEVRIGSADFVDARQAPSADGAAGDAEDDMGVMSWIYMRVNERIEARLGFGDRLKPGATEVVRRLQGKGYTLKLVSGDSQTASEQVGARLALKCVIGNQRPAQKANLIETLRLEGRTVAMVGDGVNDAPALASADLSVAVFAGRQLGEEAQAVTLMRGDPLQLDAFLTFAERVNRKIQQNLWGSLVYNMVSIPIAMAGWLSPLVAVAAMLLSSLSVTGNTLLLIRGENRVMSPGKGPL